MNLETLRTIASSKIRLNNRLREKLIADRARTHMTADKVEMSIDDHKSVTAHLAVSNQVIEKLVEKLYEAEETIQKLKK